MKSTVMKSILVILNSVILIEIDKIFVQRITQGNRIMEKGCPFYGSVTCHLALKDENILFLNSMEM